MNCFIQSLCRLELYKFRHAEKIVKKLSNCGSAIKFNRICLQEKILPKYTDFKLRNNDQRRAPHTVQFRNDMLKSQIKEKEALEDNLKRKLEIAKLEFLTCCRTGVVDNFFSTLEEIKVHEDSKNFSRIAGKLNSLYRGTLYIKEAKKSFYNLTNYELNDAQVELLNMGMNYHIASKFDPLLKMCELEKLYEQLLNLEKKKDIMLINNIEAALVTEGHKNRAQSHRPTLNKQLLLAAEELKKNPTIIVRKAD